MKNTFPIDDRLLMEVKKATGADPEAIRPGLEELIRAAAYKRSRPYS
jgi:hypothetical protein